MERFYITIDRLESHSSSIIGQLSVNGKPLCYTLELAWLWNSKNVSCIPTGRYQAKLRYDHKDQWRIELMGVPGGRTHIQIHVGNYPRDVEGCVLVGTSYSGNAVLNSARAYDLLKAEFYGSGNVTSSPDKTILVEFKGIHATPWGDYATPRGADQVV